MAHACAQRTAPHPLVCTPEREDYLECLHGLKTVCMCVCLCVWRCAACVLVGVCMRPRPMRGGGGAQSYMKRKVLREVIRKQAREVDGVVADARAAVGEAHH
jgi:hypothetical protein